MKDKLQDILDEFSKNWTKEQLDQLVRDWQKIYGSDEQPSLKQLALYLLDIRSLI